METKILITLKVWFVLTFCLSLLGFIFNDEDDLESRLHMMGIVIKGMIIIGAYLAAIVAGFAWVFGAL